MIQILVVKLVGAKDMTVLGGKFTDSGKCGEERSCGVIMGYLNHI